MKTIRLMLVVSALALPVASFAATAPAPKTPKPSAPNPLAPRFNQVRDRIGALFQHRNAPPPPLDPAHNPFRLPGTGVPVPVATGREREPAPPPADTLTLLQQAVATLKISGVFERAGRSHLVINARPYKEGDVLQTQVKGEPVYLRVKKIIKGGVTLDLNGAETVLNY